MRLATGVALGKTLWGPIIDDRLVDMTATFESPTDLLIGATASPDRVATLDPGAAPSHPLSEVELLPPIPRPNKIICVGKNYADHIAEMGQRDDESPDQPVLFVRFASSLVGSGQAVRRPSISHCFDFEGELAVVIGKTAWRVPEADALSFVAGYSCFMDGTIRDFQRHTGQFTPGKNFDCSGSWGPWVTTADEIADPSSLGLVTRLDGEIVQSASTAQMIFGIEQIVSYCSSFASLEAGDVIATGTPAGVGAGRTPPLWLSPGSLVEVSIEGVGTLANPVAEEIDRQARDAH